MHANDIHKALYIHVNLEVRALRQDRYCYIVNIYLRKHSSVLPKYRVINWMHAYMYDVNEVFYLNVKFKAPDLQITALRWEHIMKMYLI